MSAAGRLFLLLVVSSPAAAEQAAAQVLSKADATCVNVMNGEGRKVAMATAKLGRLCVDAEAKGKQSDADACVAADAKGAVAKALDKAVAQDGKKCATPPAFAYAGVGTRNDAARAEAEALQRDALDGGTGLAVVALATDKAGAKCQKTVLGALDKIAATTIAEFNKCKKKALKTVTAGDALRDDCFVLLGADRASPKGKIAKAAANLDKQRAKHCATTDLAAAFPGRCAAETGAAFSACLDARAACRACRALDAMDALGADCDAYDDGVANGSCAEVVPAFQIAIGDTVSDGVPAAGAGNLETSGSVDVYEFDAPAGTTIYLDEQAFISPAGPPYVLVDEDGLTVASDAFGGVEPGRLVLVRGGRYTITVGDPGDTATGTYQFTLWPVEDDAFAIAIGDTVSDGVPGAGAGNVETPGARDVYTFTASAGDVVFLNELAVSGPLLVDVVVTDPLGATINTGFLGGGDPGAITITQTGTHTITVGENQSDATGTYSFALSLTPADDVFAIALGDTVSDGVPAAGAGNVEFPGARDVYTFTVTAGDVVFVNEISVAPGILLLDYVVTDPLGNVVIDDFLGGSDPGSFTAAATGTCTITVGDPLDDATGTYSFAISLTPPEDEIAIAYGDAVSDGVPALGAGNIEVPGAFDRYTFVATAGDVVFVDETFNSGSVLLLDYRILDPNGATVLTDFLGGSDPGAFTAALSGTYTISIGDPGDDATGTYAFTLHLVPADDTFAIALGDTVSDGVPAAGAGNVEVPGSFDVYTFTAAAGDVVFLDETFNSGGVLLLDYRILDPNGATVLTSFLGGSDPGAFTAALGGTYTIRIGDLDDDAAGTYAFTLYLVPADDEFAIAAGDTVSNGVPGAGAGNIEVPGAFDVYTFAGTAGQTLLFDELATSGTLLLDYRILDPMGTVVLSNALGGADPAPLLLGSTGTYTIEVGDLLDDAVGTYSFAIAWQ